MGKKQAKKYNQKYFKKKDVTKANKKKENLTNVRNKKYLKVLVKEQRVVKKYKDSGKKKTIKC